MSIATVDTDEEVVRRHGEQPRTSCPRSRGHEKRPCTDAASLETIRKLRAELERYRYQRARRAGWTRRFVPTGLTDLDAALPHGGLPRGAITEILSSSPGVGATSLAMRIAGQCCINERGETARIPDNIETSSLRPSRSHVPSSFRSYIPSSQRHSAIDNRHVVFVDTLGDFYPPAAWRHGIDLNRLMVIRPRNARDAFWAVDQCLRCRGVATVIAQLTGLDDRNSRRLQLAAESSGGVGLILRPSQQRTRSFAAVRMLIEGVGNEKINSAAPFLRSDHADPTHHDRTPVASHLVALCRITLLAVREGNPAKPILTDLNHAQGACIVHPIPVDRSIARTG